MFGREITKDSEKVSLLNTDKEETLLSETNDKPNEYNLFYDYIVNGNHKYIGFGYQYLYESVYSKLYDLKLNVIYNVDKRSSYNINSNEYYNGNISFSENGNFYEYYDGKFNEYDPNGKKLKSINIDGEVKMVIDKYAVVINNTSLVLKTMDKTITIDKWDDDRVFHNDLSYYDKGVHLVVGYNESLINYYYNPSTGKVTF